LSCQPEIVIAASGDHCICQTGRGISWDYHRFSLLPGRDFQSEVACIQQDWQDQEQLITNKLGGWFDETNAEAGGAEIAPLNLVDLPHSDVAGCAIGN
jgi:hypothetical protein